MRNQASVILVAALALASFPTLASSPQGADVEANGRLTPKQCLALQAAKHDGSSKADMKKACQWTTDENGPNDPSSAEKPRAVDPAPNANPPGMASPPPH